MHQADYPNLLNASVIGRLITYHPTNIMNLTKNFDDYFNSIVDEVTTQLAHGCLCWVCPFTGLEQWNGLLEWNSGKTTDPPKMTIIIMLEYIAFSESLVPLSKSSLTGVRTGFLCTIS